VERDKLINKQITSFDQIPYIARAQIKDLNQANQHSAKVLVDRGRAITDNLKKAKEIIETIKAKTELNIKVL
jgi:hypothetical protein